MDEQELAQIRQEMERGPLSILDWVLGIVFGLSAGIGIVLGLAFIAYYIWLWLPG